jgi:hypothetical protein
MIISREKKLFSKEDDLLKTESMINKKKVDLDNTLEE